jgi:hypothetical protein
MKSIVDEIRKNIDVVEYRQGPNQEPPPRIPEIPDWAKKMSNVFRSSSSTPDAVQKSVAIMAEKILIPK